MGNLSKITAGIGGRRGLTERLSKIHWPSPPHWFHFASSGEFEQCLPIVEAVKAHDPRTQVFLSYFSPTAARALKLEYERRMKAAVPIPWDHADYLPYDFPWSVRRFFDVLHPLSFNAIHREIWPAVLAEGQRRKIPRRLFACHFPTPPTAKPLKPLFRKWLERFDFIGTTDLATRDFLASQLSRSNVPIAALGDPRIDRVLARKKMGKAPAWTGFFGGKKILVLASLWPEDLRALRSSLGEVLAHPGWRIVAVPHEPYVDFCREIVEALKTEKKSARLWSRWSQVPDEESHLVVDAVGFLAELYRIANLVFVGGSFKAKVHNVLEPAAYACPILTGPYIQNSGEAVEMSNLSGALCAAQSEGELLSEVKRLLGNPSIIDERSQLVTKYLEDRKGASARYAQLIF